MNSVLWIFALGLVTLVPVRVTSQASYDDSLAWGRYQPGSLQAIIRQNGPIWLSDAPAKGVTFAIGGRYPTRARVVFLGETRPLPPTRTQFIGAWIRSQLQMDSASVLALYKREVLVREGKRRFWLPVQEVAWANNKELWVRNRPIVVLVQLVGAKVVDRVPDWVFLVMTVEPPPHDSIEAAEFAAIRDAEGRASRMGRELRIQLLDGHAAIFRDDTTLGADTIEVEHFSLPRYAGYLKAIHSHVIHEIPYEGNGGYLIVDDSTGDSTAIAGMPVLSPDGMRFVATSMAGAAEFDAGLIEIWRMVGRKPKKEFSYNTEHESWGASNAVWRNSVTISFIKKLDRDARAPQVGLGLLTRSGGTWVLTGSPR